jgi:hypothetical protein
MPRDERYFEAMYPDSAARIRALTAGTRAHVTPGAYAQNGHGGVALLDIAAPPLQGSRSFPHQALPIGVWSYLFDVARTYGVEPEMAGVPLLVCLGAAIGNSRRILLKPGYSESALLWAVLVARPGSVKTPVLMDVAEPLREYERYLDEQNGRRQADYEHSLSVWETARRDTRGERPTAPVAQRSIVHEPTMEELAHILADNPRGLLLLQDEITGWVRGMNQYKAKGSDRSRWLSIWSSVEFSVDRRSEHGKPLRVWQPFVGVTGGIQPDLLHELRPMGTGDDGFLDRLLFSWPEDRVRRWTEATIDPFTRDRYRQIVLRLLALEMEPDAQERLRPKRIPLREDAKALWVERYNAHRDEMMVQSFDPRLHGAWAKLDSYAARFALIVHCARAAAEECEDDALDTESVEGAWSLVDYFKAGARRAYSRFEQSETDLCVSELIAWVRGMGASEVTLRDAMRARRRGFGSASSGQGIFAAAADRGYGRVESKPQPNGGKTIVSLVLSEESAPMS